MKLVKLTTVRESVDEDPPSSALVRLFRESGGQALTSFTPVPHHPPTLSSDWPLTAVQNRRAYPACCRRRTGGGIETKVAKLIEGCQPCESGSLGVLRIHGILRAAYAFTRQCGPHPTRSAPTGGPPRPVWQGADGAPPT